MANPRTLQRDAAQRAKDVKAKDIISPLSRAKAVESFNEQVKKRPLSPPGKRPPDVAFVSADLDDCGGVYEAESIEPCLPTLRGDGS